MVFDEEKAAKIIKRYGLSDKTYWVWKTRGEIPDRYFVEGYEIKKKASGERDEQTIRDIKRILEYRKINIKAIGRLMEIKEIRLRDIMYKNLIPTKEELLALKKAIMKLRNEAIEIVSLFNKMRVSEEGWKKLEGFLSRTEIRCVPIFEKKSTGRKMLDWMGGKRKSYPEESVDEILQGLGVFITETGML